MNDKKQVIITGYYGSGKSEFSLNYALRRKKETNERINIVDLDIINPYFRTREKEKFLNEHGVYILGNSLKNHDNSDLPQISADMFQPIHQDQYGIYDLGGNESGLRVLASLKPQLDQVGYDLFVVVNVFRDETDTVDKIIRYVKMVELYGYTVTGIVNNSNLLDYTTVEHFMFGDQIIQQACLKLNKEIKYGLVSKDLYESLSKQVEYPLIATTRILKPWN